MTLILYLILSAATLVTILNVDDPIYSQVLIGALLSFSAMIGICRHLKNVPEHEFFASSSKRYEK